MRPSKSYRKYTWVGNRISAADMALLYKMKQKTKRPITLLVAEAVSRYVEEPDKEICQTCSQCRTVSCNCPEFKAAVREFRRDTIKKIAKILVIE